MYRNLLKQVKLLIPFLLLLAGVQSNSFAQYCIPDYVVGTGDDDYIDRVVLEDIDNTTGPGADFNDYTDISTILSPGVTYTMTLYNTPAYSETYEAWIDYNQDETYTTDESLGTIVIAAGGSGTITFTAAAGALPGSTRMRVMCVYNGVAPLDPCSSTYYYGEAEDYAIIFPAAGAYDLALVHLNGLGTSCGLGITPINVTVTNVGTDVSGSFSIAYRVTDPVLGMLSPVIEAYTGSPIPSLESADYTFAAPADLSNIGDYTIDAWVIYAPDVSPINDSSDKSLTNIPVITAYPYLEDFESGEGGWSTGGLNSSWEMGTPAGVYINTPPPATPTSQNSWTTSLTGYYNAGEQSYVVSPCIDMTSFILPYLECDFWVDAPEYDDGSKIQYSTDAGATWSDLGSVGSGENWYNSYAYSLYPLSYTYDAWTGYPGLWQHAHHDIAFLAGESSVKFRFIFSSYSFLTPFHDGFAFDNFLIADPDPNDVGITDITAPSSSCSLGSSEHVTVSLENDGIDAQTGFPINYQINGGSIVTELYPGLLNPGEIATYTFSASEDLSVYGDYDIDTWTSLAGDIVTDNDSSSKTVTSVISISGFPYSEDFESGSGGWVIHNNDLGTWELAQPAGAVLSGPPPTTPSSQYSYITNADGNYNDDDISWVQSPCFDFTSLSLPYITLDIDYNTENSFDGAKFQYSFDYGATWVDIENPGENWYVGTAYALGGDSVWIGTSGWLTAEHDLGFLAGQPSVTFRILFQSDPSINYEGFAFDNILIKDPEPKDLGILDITTPTPDCDLSNSEAVTVSIKNYGSQDQAGFPVSYQVDGGSIVTETYAGTVTPGEVASYTFTATADFSADGPYLVYAWTGLVGDAVPENDGYNEAIINLSTEVTTGFDSIVCDGGGTLFPAPIAPGGTWSGTGIIDASTGEFDPSLVGVGNSTLITYNFTPTGSYTVAPIDYNPSAAVAPIALALGDDSYIDDVPLGFSFYYFGNSYDHVFVASNGYVGFGTASSYLTPQYLPDAFAPNNQIAFCWTDLNPSAGGEVNYETQGVAPNRKFIVNYIDVPHYGAVDLSVSGQIILFEGSNVIEIHSSHIDSDGGLLTQGIENATGTEAYPSAPEYNDADFSMFEQAYRFGPSPCDATATSTITISVAPDIDLGPDLEACDGTVFTLDAGPGADTYLWNTGAETQTIDVNTTGTYSIEYNIGMGCTVFDNVNVTINPNPVVDLGAGGEICEGTTLDAENPGLNYAWNTGATTQTIAVDATGLYNVTVTNPLTGCTAFDEVNLTVNYLPVSDFTYTVSGTIATFTSTSLYGTTYSWSFGDGGSSTGENPTHTYASVGTYTVTLTITNECGSSYISYIIQVVDGINDPTLAQYVSLYPNPTSGNTVLSIQLPAAGIVTTQVFNSLGQMIIDNGSIYTIDKVLEIDLSDYPSGIYSVVVSIDDKHVVLPLVITK